MGLFKHLPVTSLEDVTQNFEQLEKLLEEIKAELAKKAGGK